MNLPMYWRLGVAGFPRVMVVIDDEEVRGFLFSYGKLFGVKEKSTTDIKNEEQRLETTMADLGVHPTRCCFTSDFLGAHLQAIVIL